MLKYHFELWVWGLIIYRFYLTFGCAGLDLILHWNWFLDTTAIFNSGCLAILNDH
jgi:hypothetical protein